MAADAMAGVDLLLMLVLHAILTALPGMPSRCTQPGAESGKSRYYSVSDWLAAASARC